MKRSAGILLHPTSLPSPYGIGDLGPAAYAWVDFLQAAGQSIWEVLPLNLPDFTGSPYASVSAMAGNWLLISPDQLVEKKLLHKNDLPRKRKVERIQYGVIKRQQQALIARSYQYFMKRATKSQQKKFVTFQRAERNWLPEYAVFMALKDQFHGKPWHHWPKQLANRQPGIIHQWQKKLSNEITLYQYGQWLFDIQWHALKKYANKKGIDIFGDVPFFVTHDSVDVWAHRQYFMLDKRNLPGMVSGVPPDRFSKRGQIWGDPQFNWQALAKDKFAWWVNRFTKAFKRYDLVRVDHFRGYRALWQIKRNSKTARHGTWLPVPGEDLFAAVKKKQGKLPVIAEDLGTIFSDVVELRKQLGFPGVRVLQFAFNGMPHNYNHPDNYDSNTVVFTGTHDNDTTRGWISRSGNPRERRLALQALRTTPPQAAAKLIQLGMRSPANLCIAPLQDHLNLGSEARLNKPATAQKNWRWRFHKDDLSATLSRHILTMTRRYKR